MSAAAAPARPRDAAPSRVYVLLATGPRRVPTPPTYVALRRIAATAADKIARAIEDAVRRLKAGVDPDALLSAAAAGNLSVIESVAGSGRIQAILLSDPRLINALTGTITMTGDAAAGILTGAGMSFAFNAADPNVVLYARTQLANLVRAVGDDVKDAIRAIVALGHQLGLTPEEQAAAIMRIVGLPPNWAAAPTNLRNEILSGRFTASRRLSAADKAQIQKRIREGTADAAFADRMAAKYAASLRRRRALNIARTEGMRAANYGLRLSWEQATGAGALPPTVRRVVVVTPDERLRPRHLMAASMNKQGVRVGAMFDTPWGPQPGPPWPADPYNCRCSEALVFPGTDLFL